MPSPPNSSADLEAGKVTVKAARKQQPTAGPVHWRNVEWSKRWGWNMFVVPMGSGAVTKCIISVPYPWRGQETCATVFLFINIVTFLVCVYMTVLRAVRHWPVFVHSFFDQTEGPWIATVNLSMATIMIGFISLGIPRTGPWFLTTCEVLFYIYLGLGLVTGITIQNTFRRLPRPMHRLAPNEVLEIYPLLLAGSIAGNLAASLGKHHPERALTVWCFGMACTGLGFFTSLLILSAWMTRYILLPRASAAILPGYMIAAGAFGFVGSAMVALGHTGLTLLPANGFLDPVGVHGDIIGTVFMGLGVWTALMCSGMFGYIAIVYLSWGLGRGVGMLWNRKIDSYQMTLWSWTFPLSGMTLAWGRLASYLPSKGFGILNIMATLFVLALWIINVVGTGIQLWNGQLPGVPRPFDPVKFKMEMASTLELEPIRHRHAAARSVGATGPGPLSPLPDRAIVGGTAEQEDWGDLEGVGRSSRFSRHHELRGIGEVFEEEVVVLV